MCPSISRWAPSWLDKRCGRERKEEEEGEEEEEQEEEEKEEEEVEEHLSREGVMFGCRCNTSHPGSSEWIIDLLVHR